MARLRVAHNSLLKITETFQVVIFRWMGVLAEKEDIVNNSDSLTRPPCRGGFSDANLQGSFLFSTPEFVILTTTTILCLQQAPRTVFSTSGSIWTRTDHF